MKAGSGCKQCTHPSCNHGLNANGVASCSDGCDGVLVLDLTSGPKWQLACNKCAVVVKVCQDANKLSVDDATCDECDARLLRVEYRPEKNKLPDGLTKLTACIFCSSQLSSLVEKRYASAARGRGRGRSRGRGGRGRGRRGRGKPKDKMAQLAAYFV
jgi:DNA topoisomerase-3